MQTNYLLRDDEKTILTLRALYESHGYRPFRMSKFEEYDFYADNRKFLIGSGMLTFTGASGRLMALKPDVTLSIVKNTEDADNTVTRVCYNESVYRADRGGDFKEIMQTGLECIGNIDGYPMGEVTLLAAMSLETISERYILDVSHMGYLEGFFDYCNLSDDTRVRILKAMSRKEISSITELAEREKVNPELLDKLCSLTMLYDNLETALPTLRNLCDNDKCLAAVNDLEDLLSVLSSFNMQEKVMVDFSLSLDLDYYNGIVFRGFIEGISSAVLSGGRYDNLMKKLGKKSGAAGFAVYLDKLGSLKKAKNQKLPDAALLYTNDDSPSDIATALRNLKDKFSEVVAVPENTEFSANAFYKLEKGELKSC